MEKTDGRRPVEKEAHPLEVRGCVRIVMVLVRMYISCSRTIALFDFIEGCLVANAKNDVEI